MFVEDSLLIKWELYINFLNMDISLILCWVVQVV